MSNRIGWTLAVLFVGLLIVGGVVLNARKDRHEREIGTTGRPVVFILSPEHGRRISPEDRRALAELVQRESGLKIDLQVASSPLDAIESFDEKADIGLLNLFEYLLARNEYRVEACLQALRRGDAANYTGDILVRADGPIRTLADLSGKRIAYGDPFSTSGFVFPAKILADAGVQAQAEFAGSHDQSLARLRAGDVDAAATYTGAAAGDSSLRFLAQTDSIPNEPVFVRAGIKPEIRDRLINGLQKIASTPEGARLLATVADITGYRPVSDADYQNVLAAARLAGKTVYELVPDGIHADSSRRGISFVP